MRYYIDPHNITNFNRSKRELQTFYMFCVLVAGKNSAVQSKKLGAFLSEAPCNMLPFTYIQHLWNEGMLMEVMGEHKLGQYKRLFKCFTETPRSIEDLSTINVFGLQNVYGVGPKTARFFLTHSREHTNFAVLDTHVLRWMREVLGVPTPKATPSGSRYSKLEQIFLNHCRETGKTPAELDLQIWSGYNKGNGV